MWQAVSGFCGMYAFFGFFVLYLAGLSGNAVLIALAIIAWIGNMALLGYANKKW